MKNTNENIESLLLKQLHGELSTAEQDELEQWLKASAENREGYAALLAIWEASPPVLNSPVFDTAAAWKKVQHGLSGERPASGKRIILRYSWLAAACGLLIVAVIWYFNADPGPRENTVFAADCNRLVTLPDSSTIYLRKGSRLAWTEASPGGHGPRVAQLDGDAFFEIRHNTQRPFMVDTRQATFEELGTSFAIRQEDTVCLVLVTAGAIKCTARDPRKDAIILTAGEQASLGANGWVRYKEPDPNFLSWKDQKLAFAQAPIDSVIAVVQEKYGVPITLSPDLLSSPDKMRVTVRFGAREQLKDVLEEIRLTTGLGIEHKKDTIIFFRP